MKILKILLSNSLIFPIALMACSDECINKNSFRNYHGNNGKNGQNGENGQNGKDGEFYGGNGGNGGNGVRGGDGGNGGFHGGNGGNGGNGGKGRGSLVTTAPGQVEESEYKELKDNCRQILEIILSKFYDPTDSLCLTTYKQNISIYLLEVGTPAAQKILQEYENVSWSYSAIANL